MIKARNPSELFQGLTVRAEVKQGLIQQSLQNCQVGRLSGRRDAAENKPTLARLQLKGDLIELRVV